MSRRRTLSVSIEVTIPAGVDVDDDQVATLVGKLLDVGLADARDTADDQDASNEDAELVMQLEFADHTTVVPVWAGGPDAPSPG